MLWLTPTFLALRKKEGRSHYAHPPLRTRPLSRVSSASRPTSTCPTPWRPSPPHSTHQVSAHVLHRTRTHSLIHTCRRKLVRSRSLNFTRRTLPELLTPARVIVISEPWVAITLTHVMSLQHSLALKNNTVTAVSTLQFGIAVISAFLSAFISKSVASLQFLGLC